MEKKKVCEGGCISFLKRPTSANEGKAGRVGYGRPKTPQICIANSAALHKTLQTPVSETLSERANVQREKSFYINKALTGSQPGKNPGRH